jgi:hypothetical protein
MKTKGVLFLKMSGILKSLLILSALSNLYWALKIQKYSETTKYLMRLIDVFKQKDDFRCYGSLKISTSSVIKPSYPKIIQENQMYVC